MGLSCCVYCSLLVVQASCSPASGTLHAECYGKLCMARITHRHCAACITMCCTAPCQGGSSADPARALTSPLPCNLLPPLSALRSSPPCPPPLPPQNNQYYKKAYETVGTTVAAAQSTTVYKRSVDVVYPYVKPVAEPAMQKISSSKYVAAAVAHVQPVA
jgi:hypothetical protein